MEGLSTRLVRALGERNPPFERRFGLMAELLLVQTDSHHVLDAAEQAFGRYPMPVQGAEPLVLRLFVDPAHDSISTDLPSAWAAPRYLADGPLFAIDLAGDGVAVVDQVRGIATGRVSGRLARDVAYLRWHVVEAMALSMLCTRGYVSLHAACVVIDGVGVTIQAPAGTGKSTVAYAALRRGLGILAEDTVFARRSAAGPVELWGAPWRLHLLPDAPHLFPELSQLHRRRQVSGEWKLEVDVEQHFPGSATPSASAGAQVLLARGPHVGPPVESLDRLAAHQAFEVHWPWGIPWSAQQEQVVDALRSGGVHQVRMSGSPDEAVDLLIALVERLGRDGHRVDS